MTPDERWEAVAAHDAGRDGTFVYAVCTTGVYCRPSCPARRPLRRNVEFFDLASDAEAAGYRSCRRCRPAEAGGPPSRMARAVADACRLIDGADRTMTLAELAGQVGLSPHYLQRSFTRLVGSTPRQYAAATRRERARGRLREGAAVTDALYDAGYGSSRAFYEGASGDLGMRPATYRRGGVAQAIRFTEVDSPLGPLLVAATGTGVCAVRFLGDPLDRVDDAGATAEDLLRAEFPSAACTRDDEWLGPTAQRVVAVMGGADDRDLPLDVRATAFQFRVWRALRAIPRGETRSYTQVAAAVGRPTAVRAVAGACAANPVAVVVPCHRVVAADGTLAGYRWGVERKAALLASERGDAD